MPMKFEIIVPDEIVMQDGAHDYVQKCMASFLQQAGAPQAVIERVVASEEKKAEAPAETPAATSEKAKRGRKPKNDQSAPTQADAADEAISAAINKENVVGATRTQLNEVVNEFLRECGMDKVDMLKTTLNAHPIQNDADTVSIGHAIAAVRVLMASMKAPQTLPERLKADAAAAAPATDMSSLFGAPAAPSASLTQEFAPATIEQVQQIVGAYQGKFGTAQEDCGRMLREKFVPPVDSFRKIEGDPQQLGRAFALVKAAIDSGVRL